MNIKEMRLQTGMTRQEFAYYFNIPKGTLRNWEQGIVKPADYLLNMINKILTYDNKFHIYNGKYNGFTYYWNKNEFGYYLYIKEGDKNILIDKYTNIVCQHLEAILVLLAEIAIENYIKELEAEKIYEKLHINA